MINSVVAQAVRMLESNVIFEGKILKFPANFASLRFSDKNHSLHHQILLDACLKAEKIFPGGSTELVRILASSRVFDTKQNHLFYQPNRQQLFDHLTSLGHDDFIFNLCMTALDFAGSNGKIIIEKTHSNETSLELRTGSQFEINSPLGNFEIKDPRIVIFDGFVESVSEIHHLLTQVSDTGDDVILIARGYHDDVLLTLSLNLKRGLVKVRPITVKFDETGINTLKDMCVVTGSSMITSDMGLLLTGIKISEFPRIKSCQVNDKKIYLENPSQNYNIQLHFQDLLNRIKDSDTEMHCELLKLRAQSLSTRQVTIRLPNKISVAVIRQSLDSCFRQISHITKNGMCVDKQTFIQSALNNLIDQVKISLDSLIIE